MRDDYIEERFSRKTNSPRKAITCTESLDPLSLAGKKQTKEGPGIQKKKKKKKSKASPDLLIVMHDPQFYKTLSVH